MDVFMVLATGHHGMPDKGDACWRSKLGFYPIALARMVNFSVFIEIVLDYQLKQNFNKYME